MGFVDPVGWLNLLVIAPVINYKVTFLTSINWEWRLLQGSWHPGLAFPSLWLLFFQPRLTFRSPLVPALYIVDFKSGTNLMTKNIGPAMQDTIN